MGYPICVCVTTSRFSFIAFILYITINYSATPELIISLSTPLRIIYMCPDNYYSTTFAKVARSLDDKCQDQLHLSRCQSSLVASSYFFVNGLWHSSCEPVQRQYVIHDRLAAKQLQFPWVQALPAALHWQLMTFINSGGAGSPLAITGDGMLLSISQPQLVMRIAGATCFSAAFLDIVF